MLLTDFAIETRKTYKDYLLSTPEGGKYQLINGEIIDMGSPTVMHQQIIIKLIILFNNFINKSSLGTLLVAPMDVYFTDYDVLQPDLLFISKENQNKIEENRIKGAPDLVIEVLSSSNAYYDLKKKKSIYELHGVKEYWIVDPMEKNIEIYMNNSQKFELVEKSDKNNQIAHSQVLKGLEIKLEEIF